jgi:methyl-accepting chemotaxis protein I, serine sensor receptor
VAEISAASEEQASGIDQVNSAVTLMDTTTQQNAALVEEAAAASKAMEQQAQTLVEKVSYFSAPGADQRVVESTKSVSSAPSATVRQMSSRKTSKPKPVSRASRPSPIARAVGDDTSWQEF